MRELTRAFMIASIILGSWNLINLLARVYFDEMIIPYPWKYQIPMLVGSISAVILISGW